MNRDKNILDNISKEIRFDVVDMVYKTKDGHPGPALGIADIVTALYFSEMNIDPGNPDKPDRDRLILSKGHACPVIYATLGRLGFFPRDILPTLRTCGSILQGHPCMKKTKGIDMTSGSLGNGISIGVGMEIARQRAGGKWYTYVITGDGELNEGVIWEGALAAVQNKCENLIVFIDFNNNQSGGHTDDVSGINPIAEKWRAFRWHVQEIDGHDYDQIFYAIDAAKKEKGYPSVIVAKTTKGKGVSYMEDNNDWHKAVPTKEQWEIAKRELLGGI
jgi:transketolase